MNDPLERELREQLDQLPPDQQRQVLDFARALASKRRGTPSGQALSQFGGGITKEDLRLITQAIEEGCEQVNRDEW
jgi:hypothetical protein